MLGRLWEILSNKCLYPILFRLPLYLGVVLHELYLANWIIIKRKWDRGIKTKVKSVMAMLQECQRCLEEAKEILKNEINTPAGEKLINLVATSTNEFRKFLERNKVDFSAKEKTKENGVENGVVNENEHWVLFWNLL